MTIKNWHVAATAAIATLGVAKALGFVTPGERLSIAEKPALSIAGLESERELRDEVRAHSIKITTLEANYANLDRKVTEGNLRVEGKLDKLIDLQLRSRRAP